VRELKLLLIAAIGIGLVVGVISNVSPYLSCAPPSTPVTRVLIVDNSLSRPIYSPARHWEPHLGEVHADVVHIPGDEPIPSLADYTHVIISGSTASFLDPPDWVSAEVQLVREAADLGLALLGSCFGHQMLAYALSGSEYVRRAESPEVGWIAVEVTTEDELFEGLPNPWHAFAWHYDEVVNPPEPWRVIGSSSSTAVHVMRYGDAPIWGLQSHPETRPGSAKLLLLLTKVFRDWRSAEIHAALQQDPEDDRIIAIVMERFLKAGPRL